MPIQMKCEPHDAPVTPAQVPYTQQLQNVVGVQHFATTLNIPVTTVSTSVPSASTHKDAATPKDASDGAADDEEESIEDRLDVDSIKGVFGWETVDDINVPYILRRKNKFVAVRIVERKLLSRYPNSFPDELGKKEPLVSYFVTDNEAKLLNEINSIHCSFEYGQQEFTGKDLIVDLSEFREFFNIVKRTFPDEVLAKMRAVPQPTTTAGQPSSVSQTVASKATSATLGHDKAKLAKVCGWVQINNTVSPYIKRFNGKYVPLSVIKYAAGLLKDVQIEGILPSPAECKLLNDTCKIAGFDFSFGQSTKVIHLSEVTHRCQVNILELPFEDPLSHAQYLDLSPTTQTPKVAETNVGPAVYPPSNNNLGVTPTPVETVATQNPFMRYRSPFPPPPYPYMTPMAALRQQIPPQVMPLYPEATPGQQQYPHFVGSMMAGPAPNITVTSMQSLLSKPNIIPTSNMKPSVAANPFSMNTSKPSYGHNLSRSPFGSNSGNLYSTNTTPPYAPNPHQISTANQHSAMYMHRMMSSQGMPNGHPPGAAPYISHPGAMIKSRSSGSRSISPQNQQKYVHPMTPRSTATSANSVIISPKASSVTKSLSKIIDPNNSKFQAFKSFLTNTCASENPVPQSQTSPSTSRPVNANQPKTKSIPDVSENSEEIVTSITGVVLNGKSISCLAASGPSKNGQFCLIEAVCKLYFSRSNMTEFLYALQYVLKIPLFACSAAEEKAFIKYYNLPVSTLKCNKMIKLTDLQDYFPQISYMFIPPPAEEDSAKPKDSGSSKEADLASVAKAPHSDSPKEGPATKRPNGSPPENSSSSKQPCRRLEEMVKKLRQGQEGTDEDQSGGGDVIVLDD